MPRILEPFRQFLDNDGDPLVNGWLKFLESGTNNTLKNTYSDINETVANSNPLQLDANGRMPNVFGSGTYRVISFTNDEVLDAPAVQIEQFDPVGEDSTGGQFLAWASGTIYNFPDIVKGSDDNYYRSITDNNQGNDPTTDATNWEQVDFVRFYNANVEYDQGDIVYDSDGIYYQSLQGSNTGNTPSTSPTYWGFKLGSPLDSNGNQVRWSKGADIASSAALGVTGDGNYFDITGTSDVNTINATGTIGTVIKTHFDTTTPLNHSSSNLVIPCGVNYTAQAGDEFEFTEYDTGQFRCTGYALASGESLVRTGVVQTASYIETSALSGTTEYNVGDVVPSNTEGNFILDLSYTPLSTANTLRIRASITATSNDANQPIIATLCQASAQLGSTDVLRTKMHSLGAAGTYVSLDIDHEMTVNTTAQTSFSLRAGLPTSSTGTTYVNSDTSGNRKFGGNLGTGIWIEEIRT